MRVTVVSAFHRSELERPPRNNSIAPFARACCNPKSTFRLKSPPRQDALGELTGGSNCCPLSTTVLVRTVSGTSAAPHHV